MSVLCYSKETVTKHRFIMEMLNPFVSDLQLVTEARFWFYNCCILFSRHDLIFTRGYPKENLIQTCFCLRFIVQICPA